MTDGEIVLYTTEDGEANIRLIAQDGSVWLNQQQMAELFQTTKQNIGQHIKSILEDGELAQDSVVKQEFTTASDGKNYSVLFYRLEMILAVGYRVRSPRGVQFRRWATSVLKDYLVKGFAMDDERLKSPDEHDYFDELLERIRDIRASEKRFYQKVKDIYTTAVDYDPKSEDARLFFQIVQNKMLWAVTGHTAAELIAGRSDPAAPNLGLTSWKGSIVRRGDVTTAKNYLQGDEIDELNRIVVMYLDYAELQAKNRKPVTMAQWSEKLDAFLSFNERDILTNPGKIRADVAERLALERYDQFDAARREREAIEADEADIAEIERIGKEIRKNHEES